MKITTAPIYYRLKPSIVAPILVCSAAIVLAFAVSPWWLLSIPFAVLASLCGQPNLNLVDGCLAYLAIMIGFGITFFHRPSGAAICIGTLASFCLSGFEKRLTAKPVYGDPALDTGSGPQSQQAKQNADGNPH
jgi:hypothetical protein